MEETCNCGRPVAVARAGKCSSCYAKHYYRTQIARGGRRSHVYFAEAEGSGRVKIGKTKNVVARMQQLRVSSPFALRLRKVIDAKFEEDLNWHERFKHLRLHGEWFLLDPELEQAICQAEPAPGFPEAFAENAVK